MRLIYALLLGTLVLTRPALAQAPMPQPGPELKKLDYFAGSWSSAGDLKPGPMGPGGKMTASEKGDWMEGGFFLVLHSTYSGGGMGSGSGLAIMGYDPLEKVYTY